MAKRTSTTYLTPGEQVAGAVLFVIYLLVLPFVTAPLFRMIGGLLGVTISAGLYSGSPGVDGGIEAFIEKADEALYLAKKQGKNQLAVYASGTDGRLQTQTGAAPF